MALGGVLVALYFRFASKDAEELLYIAYGMIVVGTLAQVFYPEGPRYLVKRDRLDEAVTVIQGIGSANGIDSSRLEKSRISTLLSETDENEEYDEDEN